MSSYKVSFNADILYPKSRIASKHGSIVVTADADIEEVKNDTDLADYIKETLQSQIKTGVIFSLEITNLQSLTKEG